MSEKEEYIFKSLQELATLGYQVRTLIEQLEFAGVPVFLIDAIIESTTGYGKYRGKEE
jgi:hypothetical protein